MDRGAWWAEVHGVATSWTRLSDFTFTFHFHALEEEMATHSSVIAWRIPGTGEPGGLPSMGSNRVGHDWSDLAAAAAVPESLSLIFQKKKKLHEDNTLTYILQVRKLHSGKPRSLNPWVAEWVHLPSWVWLLKATVFLVLIHDVGRWNKFSAILCLDVCRSPLALWTSLDS